MISSRLSGWAQKIAPWTLVAGSASFVALFLVSPARFSHLAWESAPVEDLSAIVALGASLLGFLAAFRAPSRKSAFWNFSLGALCLLVFLEEISWGQRILHFQTPALLTQNSQGESNLHNLATAWSESVYYLGGWMLFMAWPCIASRGIPAGRAASFTAAALTAPYMDSMNKINMSTPADAFYQISIFAMLGITLLLLGRRALSQKAGRLHLTLFIHTALVAALFWAGSGRLSRAWDPTEYRELFLAAALFLYSVETLMLRQRTGTPGS